MYHIKQLLKNKEILLKYYLNIKGTRAQLFFQSVRLLQRLEQRGK
jgi:hypothetical protein